jgi:hypothetical protein
MNPCLPRVRVARLSRDWAKPEALISTGFSIEHQSMTGWTKETSRFLMLKLSRV